ncbi:HlyC/CorC family transporter [Candidatus Pelagibacter sp. HIMB109]|uniref:HlyC/CorC family transporter n=1 Tax=Candidatus Pelagibacter sp. HIMB109 TaxID=3415412 RepID=UPI003F850603
MEFTNYLPIFYIAILIVISGMFSGSETSVTSVNRSKIHKLANKGDRKAKKLLKLIDNKNDLISSILVGNNIVNILASVLATAVLIEYFGSDGIFYSTLVMTCLIVIFAEVLPKNIALIKADRFALFFSTPLTIFVKIFYPINLVLKFLNHTTYKIFGIDHKNSTNSVTEDIRNMIDMHEDEGDLHKDESEMINAILDLKEITVEKIMTHRKNIFSLNLNETKKIYSTIASSSFSRIPVWKDDPNNILGIIHAKNILSNLDDDGKISLEKVKRGIIKPWFIPETTKVKDQLNEFIKRKEKIAFVVDEYGELMGLISLEDIIEEIVGNIFDEKDFSTIGIRRINENQYRIRGDVNIRDINRELDLNLPENDSSTLAGYIIFKTEALPEVGQTFKFDNIVYEILNKNKNQITQIKIILEKSTKH